VRRILASPLSSRRGLRHNRLIGREQDHAAVLPDGEGVAGTAVFLYGVRDGQAERGFDLFG
jgi:hypothetical protein